MALSCSVVQAFAGWTFQLAFTLILQGYQDWRLVLRTFVSVLAIVSFIMLAIRPYARLIVRTTTPNGRVSGTHVFMIVLAVFVLAWASDLLGTVATDAAVVMGLALPKGPPLGTALIERVDLVASELLLPIIFLKEGLLINWAAVKKNLILWFWVEVVLLVSFITRTVATMAAAVYCGMSLKKGFLLGLIMNFRGLVEVLTYMRFVGLKNKKGVDVLPFTSIAPLNTMHQDACALILERNIAFVVVPFPKINSMADVEANTAMRGLVPLVLEQAPCSVGILVYHGLTMITMPTQYWKYHVGVLFWGGPDDREAISIACRLAHHPQVSLQIVRFRMFSETESHQQNDNDEEILHDNAVIDKLRAENNGNTRVVINEISTRNLEEVFLVIRNLGDHNYDLIIVGRKQNSSSMLGDRLNEWMQYRELGVVGDMLATDISGTSDVLVVQQQSSS
ncbi:hypothetical protein LUZ60_003470 [Juncus effusus]|nr:hypothetical protein LUZ60_003470 [Juncus effusus]